jgi:hypothetical protein
MSYIGRELRQDQAARTQFTAVGAETAVNVTYTPGQLTVFLNGIKLLDGTDFTGTNGTSIDLASALATDDVLDFIAYDTFTVADVVPASTGGTFAGNISVTKAQLDASAHTPEGTAVLSTGESGGSKFLREDGDNTCSWQAVPAGTPSITDNGNALALTVDSSEDCNFTGNIFPSVDNSKDLGSATKRWQNIYTTDLHLANDRGNWTVIEEEDYLSLRNNKTNKVYKLVMEEIE